MKPDVKNFRCDYKVCHYGSCIVVVEVCFCKDLGIHYRGDTLDTKGTAIYTFFKPFNCRKTVGRVNTQWCYLQLERRDPHSKLLREKHNDNIVCFGAKAIPCFLGVLAGRTKPYTAPPQTTQ